MLMTQRGLDAEVHYFALKDCVISYNPLANTWTGTWRDGIPMGDGVALSIAMVERLAWPDGVAKSHRDSF